MQRRVFIKDSLTALAASACAPLFSANAWTHDAPKRILVLGGTRFLGPALVEAAIADGHIVTLFNRGVTNSDLFPHLDKLRGFRTGDANHQDLSALQHRHFDGATNAWPNHPPLIPSLSTFLNSRAIS